MLFLFLVMLSNFLIILVREKINVKLALAISTGAPTTLADEMIQTPLQLKSCLCNQKQ